MERARLVAAAREWSENGVGRIVREGAHMTLGEMAELVGVSVSTIQRWEQRRARPGGDRGAKYASVLREIMRPEWHLAQKMPPYDERPPAAGASVDDREDGPDHGAE